MISAVHGRYGSEKQWNGMKKQLSARGFKLIAHQLQIEDPDMTLDDHAAQVRQKEEESGSENIIRLLHSWGFNVGMRQVHEAVKGVITVAGSCAKGAEPVGMDAEVEHSVSYDYIKTDPQRLLLDEDLAAFVFFNDVKKREIIKQAMEDMRINHVSQDTPPLPTVKIGRPILYVVTTKDRDIFEASQREIANQIGAEVVELKGSGHFAQYSRIADLSSITIDFANRVS